MIRGRCKRGEGSREEAKVGLKKGQVGVKKGREGRRKGTWRTRDWCAGEGLRNIRSEKITDM